MQQPVRYNPRSFLLWTHCGRYRSSPHIFDSGHTSGSNSARVNRARAVPTPLSRVTIHKAYEVDQMNHHHISFIGAESANGPWTRDGQLRDKTAGPEPDVEVDNSAEAHSQELNEVSTAV